MQLQTSTTRVAWSRSLAGLVALVGAVLVAASCGGSDDRTSGSTGGPGFGDCSLAGDKCAFGCSADLGCVQCLGDTDCGAGKPPVCVLGRCEDCAATADCGAGKACFPRDHTCQPACKVEADCGGDAPLCDAVSGACVGCSTTADCAADKDNPICSSKTGQCSECASSVDCGVADPACDLQTGQCEECLVDADCTGASLCGGDHRCHATCSSSADCHEADKPLCNVAASDCVECLLGTDCPAARPICQDQHKCVECAISTDCKVPATPICNGDKCVECGDSADCTDPALPKCKGHTCQAK